MGLVVNEKEGLKNVLAGRIVNWLQTPETTGGQYNSVCVVEYEPGARAKPAHAHDNGEETIYVIQGSGKVKIGDKVYSLKQGSLALFPQSMPHMVWNTGDTTMKLVCFYGPQMSAIEYTYYEEFDFEECKEKALQKGKQMKQLLVRPEIQAYAKFSEFAAAFGIGPSDVIITNEYIYKPIMEQEHLDCTVIFQEKYGLGEPTDVMVQAIMDEVYKTESKRVIAVGGGTIIDIAKILVLEGGKTIEELYGNMASLTKKRELVILPTTCGTGSEVTNIAILNRTKLGTKQGLVSEAMFADYAVLIPEFLVNLPYKVFATSSIDALVHAAESYLSPAATPFTEMYSEKAIDTIVSGYCKIAEKGQEVWREEGAAYLRASTFAGIAFGNSGCAAVHAMSYAFGGKYHVPHGESNYQFFIEVLKVYNIKKPEGKIAELNTILKKAMEKGGFKGKGDAENGIELLEGLLGKVLVKQRMFNYGAVLADAAVFAQSTVDNQQRLLDNNYVELTQQEICSIYQSCL